MNVKQLIIGSTLSAVMLGSSLLPVFAAKPVATDNSGLETSWVQQAGCTTIQAGTLVYPAGRYLAGQPLEVGFDAYGYNFQSHLFKGSYANVYLNGDGLPPYEGDEAAYLVLSPSAATKWYWPYRDYDLQMKWNDAWMANTDCDGDGKLDRHYGFASYIGSGAWLTNQYGGDGWASLTKFVAVPEDATLTSGTWYTVDGVEIGESIWGEFAITQDVVSGEGALYVSPAGPGYGQY